MRRYPRGMAKGSEPASPAAPAVEGRRRGRRSGRHDPAQIDMERELLRRQIANHQQEIRTLRRRARSLAGQALLARVERGEKVVDLARELGLSRQSIHKLLRLARQHAG